MIPQNIKQLGAMEKIILAEDQPEFVPVPALLDKTDGIYMTWWKPTPDELVQLNAGGAVRYCVWGAFPPMMLDVTPATEIPPLEPVQ